ncbi:MAG: outer membrane protein assembly factor BamD [Candidatus Aminicenantes bacterium]|nr:outer membrane protein assembly factor BamD [Candidatus Aminicenantes bacterium]
MTDDLKIKDRKKNMFLWTAAILIATVLLVDFTGCKSKKNVVLKPGETTTVKDIYDRAKARIKKDPEKARLLFKEIIHLYPDSTYSQRAKVGIADSYFRQKDSGSLIMAANEYQEYVNLYPNSPDAVYAKYQSAMCYYKQVKKPGRDQENTHKAIQAFESMVKMYPDTEEAKNARQKIAQARQNLASHYFTIGRTNLWMGAVRGALARFKQVMDQYPEFKSNDVLFYCTGKAYSIMRDYESAISFFQRVTTDFPKSKYFKKSRKMIEKINKIKSEIKPKTEPKTDAKAEGAEKQ